MDNRYCNLIGANLIKNEYKKINNGFESVQTEIDASKQKETDLQNQVDNIANVTSDSSPAIAQALAGTEFPTLKAYRENNDLLWGQLTNRINTAIFPKADKSYVDTMVANVSSGLINVKQFGAFGDGITDDTQHMQDAIDYCISVGAALYIVGGTFLYTNRLIINSPLRIIGTGVETTKLKFLWGGAAPVTSYTDYDWFYEGDSSICVKSSNVTFEYLTIEGGTSRAGASIFNGISLHYNIYNEVNQRLQYIGSQRSIFTNVNIQGFRNGLYIFGGWNRYITCCEFKYNSDSGIKYFPVEQEIAGNWSASGDVLLACQFIDNFYGYYAKYNFECTVWNATFEYNTHAIYAEGCPDIIFKNCWNEANYDNIIVHGSAKFEGGYNINNDTVDHHTIIGAGIVTFEDPTRKLIMQENAVIFEQFNGIIIKGVELGARIENMFLNPYFSTLSQGTDVIPSSINWDLYVAGVMSVSEAITYNNHWTMKLDVSGRTDEPEFNFNQLVTITPSKSYDISFMVMTPDRSVLKNSQCTVKIGYVSSGSVVLWDIKAFDIIANNTFEKKTFTINTSSNHDSIKLYFGTAQNGTLYFAEPTMSLKDALIAGNTVVRNSQTLLNTLEIYDYNTGTLLGTMPYTAST